MSVIMQFCQIKIISKSFAGLSASVLLLLIWVSHTVSQSCSYRLSFTKITGVDCIGSNYYRTIQGICKPLDCALRCDKTAKCQAYSVKTDLCQCKLFVFDKCSHRVQSVANCTNQVTVYVRSMPGVQPGRLCPPGYIYPLYGSSYKLLTTENVVWDTANQKCSQEAGLSKFADAFDSDEAMYLCWLKKLTSGESKNYFIGGMQVPGTADKTANWYWTACNVSISSSVWNANEPSAGVLSGEGCADIYTIHYGGISDFSCSWTHSYICECQSVF